MRFLYVSDLLLFCFFFFGLIGCTMRTLCSLDVDLALTESLANKWAKGREPILHERATVMVADFHTKQYHEDYRKERTLCYILTNSGEGFLVRDDAIRKVGE